MQPSNPLHHDQQHKAKSDFLKKFPQYAATSKLDELRQTEYARLDRQSQIYLDYTGGGLHADCQVHAHMQLLTTHVLGNPHSNNPTSLAMTKMVDQARAYVLDYFNASADEYMCVFTPNASGALRLVGEAYQFSERSRYLLSFDNHNSVNGIREYARAKLARVQYVPVVSPDLRLDAEAALEDMAHCDQDANNLFAFPAQSNFSGVKHPLTLIAAARERGWDVLVDMAAYAPTNRVDIGRWQPDFATFSFYKIFGFPTGLGCLLIRRDKLCKLHRPWFAGGTIQIASVQGDGHYLHTDEAAFEDGTVDYLNIPAIETGLRHIASIGIELINKRAAILTAYLLGELKALHHDNGVPLARLLGPSNMRERGGTISMTLQDPNHAPIDEQRVEELANGHNISLRTGCFCNPGAGEVAFGLTSRDMVTIFQKGVPISFSELREEMLSQHDKAVGAIRVSVGVASNFEDVYQLIQFMRTFLNRPTVEIGRGSGGH